MEKLSNKCICGSEDIVYVEWLGAFDGFMSIKCNSCGKETHRATEKEIESIEQPELYGPVFFTFTDGTIARNNKLIENEKNN